MILLFIGVVVGWAYSGLVSDAGPKLVICIAFAVLGSIAGGLIFIMAGLGGELVVGLLSSILVLMSADVLSRDVVQD